MIGTTLGHYEITGRLGDGGMGEVYLGQDIRLKRRLALKVLSSDLAAGQAGAALASPNGPENAIILT